MLEFNLRDIEVRLHGQREDSPPEMVRIDYEIVVDAGETYQRLKLMHRDLRKFGTISNQQLSQSV